ncbi:MAG: hypothetical protein LH606_07245 [Cytophagaceae bacterium]|nr:hypothetical protein [Cytophagaceae bacterium]
MVYPGRVKPCGPSPGRSARTNQDAIRGVFTALWEEHPTLAIPAFPLDKRLDRFIQEGA